eukprot:CAMPEP_0118997494 /NCGR_PEP_ID=MMETSP1173-20130426/61837_1 /TAXON_ID=1034831 /ORGANISM="Rhizochromulina marina cf, Strain CCMP1243" /LENGTH=87 /DNA_ID=CAMNT_0006948947 /DNA_START=77 /DNA_END=337 /DNA_ORIENTATION=-
MTTRLPQGHRGPLTPHPPRPWPHGTLPNPTLREVEEDGEVQAHGNGERVERRVHEGAETVGFEDREHGVRGSAGLGARQATQVLPQR